MSNLDIVGLCGSLRAASLNLMLLKLASASLGGSAKMEIAEWRDVPILDADELANGYPPPVRILRDRLRRADGLVIATPEYNFSIPGGLKNVLDWISRGDDQPLANKPVAILSAATGPLGGARVQYDMRRVMLFVNANVLVKPEVFVGSATAKFDPATGQCNDETTRKFVTAQMAAFERWIRTAKNFTSI